jgi:hypothetical protein
VAEVNRRPSEVEGLINAAELQVDASATQHAELLGDHHQLSDALTDNAARFERLMIQHIDQTFAVLQHELEAGSKTWTAELQRTNAELSRKFEQGSNTLTTRFEAQLAQFGEEQHAKQVQFGQEQEVRVVTSMKASIVGEIKKIVDELTATSDAALRARTQQQHQQQQQ